MKTKLFIAILVAIGLLGAVISICHAQEFPYQDAVFVTTFKKVLVRPAITETVTPADEEKGTPAVTKEIEPAIYELKLDLPFIAYSENVRVNGKDVTYSYRNDLSLEGQECLALVHYRTKDMPGTTVKDERAKAEGFAGYIGKSWDTIKVAPKYKQHFTTTKADALAVVTTDKDGNVLSTEKYAEADASESVPMYVGMCGAPLKVEAAKEITKEPMEK